MVDKYVPKVGDKVKATLGDNVLIGRIIAEYKRHGDVFRVDIQPDGLREKVACFASDGWLFEQVVSVPTKFGAVIRRADGMKFVLRAPDFGQWATLSTVSVEESDATRGGFTVLFDGVDE